MNPRERLRRAGRIEHQAIAHSQPKTTSFVQYSEAHAADAVAVELPPGHALVHHPLVWHHSPPNRTGNPRRGLFANWLAPDVWGEP